MSDKPTVVEALIAVMAEVESVGKGQRNLDQGYNFRGVDDVVNAVGPVLRKHGVLPVPLLEDMSLRDVRTSRDKPVRESTVKVRYRFYGPAGDSIDAVVPGESMDFGDKGVAKAMSVAYRIVLLQTLCIPTNEPDPDSETYERGHDEPRPNQEVIDLFAVIMTARDKDALRLAWEAVRDTHTERRISDRERRQLEAHIDKRKAEMEAANDRPADSDGGSATAGEAGPGTGPTGAAAGDGGPGRDGEEGGVRPGLQPRVHSRDRQRGAAPTPGGGRDAPAAVGG